METEEILTFEVPVCTLIRSSLCIEYLLSKLHAYIQRSQPYDIQTCVSTFVELLITLDKQELRSKYFQSFSHAHFVLKKMSNDDVCPNTLQHVLTKIQTLLNILSQNRGKFAEPVRRMPFFKHIMQYQATPGSESGHLMPDYQLWLSQSIRQCVHEMESWLVHFHDIDEITRTHLMFVRDAGEFQTAVAKKGFFQDSMDSRCQMIRIRIPAEKKLYPKLSVGQHGMSIQFFSLSSVNQPSRKHTGDTPFEVAYCFLN